MSEDDDRDNVIQMFKQDCPAADPENGGSEKVWEFVQDHMGDFMSAVHGLDHASDQGEFQAYMDEIRRQVKGWPKRL